MQVAAEFFRVVQKTQQGKGDDDDDAGKKKVVEKARKVVEGMSEEGAVELQVQILMATVLASAGEVEEAIAVLSKPGTPSLDVYVPYILSHHPSMHTYILTHSPSHYSHSPSNILPY